MVLFQKPKLENKEYLANLQVEIFDVTRRLEGIKAQFEQKYVDFELDFDRRKAEKEKELHDINEKVAFLRSERVELEKPIDYKRKELNERDIKLAEREMLLVEERQNAFEREREAERKLESVKELADDLGEVSTRNKIKERLLKGREESIQQKEQDYMVKIEKLSHEVNEAAARIQERENAVIIKEENVRGKEENLVKREKRLAEQNIALNDKYATLLRTEKRLHD